MRTTHSYWLDDGHARGLAPAVAPPPAAPVSADVLVVGGGFAGLSAALAIAAADRHRQVVLVDAERIGFGASGRNAGMLTPLPAASWLLAGSLPAGEREWALGEVAARTRSAVAAYGALDGGPQPARMYLCGSSRLARAGLGWLHERLTANGAPVERLSGDAVEARIGERCRVGLAIPTWAILPARLCWSLRAEALARGVTVFEQTPIDRLEPGPAAVAAITRAGVRIEAQSVVMALGAWSSMPPLAAKGHVFQTYMMATPPLEARHLASLGETGALVGTLDRGFSYRRVVDGRLLFGGLDEPVKAPRPAGEVPAHVVPKLQSMLAAGIPALSGVPIEQAWGGAFHVAGLSDLPSLTVWPRDPRVVVCAGSAGAGVLWCLVAGPLLAGMVDARLDAGSDARFRAALQTSRLPIGSALGLAARLALRAVRGR